MMKLLLNCVALLCLVPAGAIQTYLSGHELPLEESAQGPTNFVSAGAVDDEEQMDEDLMMPAALFGVARDQPMPVGAPQLPDSAGCYVWLPNGCRSKTHALHAKLHWKRDEWGETNMRAGESAAACQARKESYDGFCRVKDSVMLFVDGTSAQPVASQNTMVINDVAPASVPQSMPAPAQAQTGAAGEVLPAAGAPQLPESAGCYVWLPNGCRSKTHALHAKLHWKRDEWGETNMRAGESAAACQARKESYDGFCRVKDSVMLFVSSH